MDEHEESQSPIRDRPAVTFRRRRHPVGGIDHDTGVFPHQALPEVGDILVFAPGDPPGDASTIRIAVHRPGQTGCVLDLDTIRQTGGSLVVEARVMQARPRISPALGWRADQQREATTAATAPICFVGTGDLGFLQPPREASASAPSAFLDDRQRRLE